MEQNLRFTKLIKLVDSLINEEACTYKKFSGSYVVFLVLYVDDILLTRYDVSILE